MKRRKNMPPRTAKTPEPPSFDPPRALGREIQEKIGDQLRALHDDIVKQGVPDRFVELLSKLDKRDPGKSDE
jgi:hypothetical protein